MAETRKAKHLRLLLEAEGHTRVRVFWDTILGWVFSSKAGKWQLGYRSSDAVKWIQEMGGISSRLGRKQ